MASRDTVFRQLGPLLIEAIQLYNLETLKLKLKDREEITEQEMLDRIQEILDGLTPYDWMNQQD